jgi:hypothetical protein
VLVLLLLSAAFAFAFLCAPPDLAFTGFLVNNDDHQLYLSFMREGAQGAWLTTIRFTPEPHRPALLLPLYLILGKIARLLGLPNELVFHLVRLLSAVLLLLVVYWFCTCFLPPGWVRQSAFLMVCFSSGLGWLLIVTGLADRAIVPVDIRIPEASTFLTMMTSPHFVLGVLLQVLTFVFYLGAGRHRGYLVGAALCLLLLSITLVYNVIVVAVALGSYALIWCWRQRRLWVPELWRALAIGAPALPIVSYYYILFRFDPFWRIAYGEHDVVRTPGVLALSSGYGLVLALALWGLAIWLREDRWSSPRVLLATWVISNGVLLYAPLAFQGKLTAGWHIGLSVLAAVGLHQGLLYRLRLQQAWCNRVATVRNVVLILSVPSTLLVAFVGFRVGLAEYYYPYYVPVRDAQAVDWLEAHTDGSDVVLASYGISNYVVAHSDARSYLGHQFAVIDPRGKARAVRRFYSRTASAGERRALVDAYGITFVYCGAHERGLEGTQASPDLLNHVSWLTPVYRQDGITIYSVIDEGEQDQSSRQ